MSLMRYQPNYWLQDIEKEIMPFFSSWMTGEPAANIQNWTPRVDVKEKDDQYLVFVDLPGVDPKDIDIEMDGHMLTIKGERKFEQEDKAENYYRLERASGKFCRQFSLPETIESEKIQAKTQQGVLAITLPKLVEQKTKKIKIEGSD